MASPFTEPLPTVGQKPWNLNPAILELRTRQGNTEDVINTGRLSPAGLTEELTEIAQGITAEELSDSFIASQIATPASDTNAALVAEIADPASPVGAQLSATIDGEIAPVRTRESDKLVRAYPRMPEPYALPSGFSSSLSLPIFWDGAAHFTTYDVAARKPSPGTVRWVDPVNGDNGNNGTEAAPKKSLGAMITASVEGDQINIVNGDSRMVVMRENGTGAGGTQMVKGVSIVPTGDGKLIYASASALSWSVSAGNMYVAARTNVDKVVDLDVLDDGYPYVKASSTTECQATPGSWYQASAGANVYVHTLDGSEPTNSRILALVKDYFFDWAFTTNAHLYMEGFTIMGGGRGPRFVKGASGTVQMTLKNMRAVHNTGWSENSGNAWNFYGIQSAWLQDCFAGYSAKDGFNYHQSTAGSPTHFVEINCEAHSCGLTQSDNVHNGSTQHDGGKGIRIGGTYHHTKGTPVADVHVDTQTVNLSCDSWDSVAPSGMYNGAFSAQQAGAEMWLDNCRGFGTENDIYAASGATIHALNTQRDTLGGNGTIAEVARR